MQHLSGNGIGERDALRIRPSRQAKQTDTAGISFRIQRVPEARDTIPPPEAAGDHRPRVSCNLHLPQEGLDELDLTTMLDATERRKPGQNSSIRRGPGRSNTPGGEGRDGQLVVHTKDERGVEKVDSPWIFWTPATLERPCQPRSGLSGTHVCHQAEYPRAGARDGARTQVVGGRV